MLLMSETVIVSALRRGEVARAVELLLDSYNDELFVYCVRQLGAGNAASVYHRLIGNVITSLGQFDGRTTLRAWLFAIARREVLTHHRHFPALFPEAQAPDYCPHGDRREGPSGSPHIHEALRQLDPSVQELLQLCFWHGLQVAEAAFVVGRSVSEVRSLCSRGLLFLDDRVRGLSHAPS